MKFISAGGSLFIGGCILFQTGAVTDIRFVAFSGAVSCIIGVVLIVIGLLRKSNTDAVTPKANNLKTEEKPDA